jgi:hypothetical protein
VASILLPTLVGQTASADRAEEALEWRPPIDLAALADDAGARLPAILRSGAEARDRGATVDDTRLSDLAWQLLGDEPESIVGELLDLLADGATLEQAARAVAFAAALRITRFHTQNDHGDWNQVHHAFTTANALHQAAVRRPTPELARGVVHSALRVYLDRFLNIPAARLPRVERVETNPGLSSLSDCWDRQGAVDEAGSIAYRFLAAGGDPAELVAALGHALLAEDAGFHWYQVFEAAIRQHRAWPEASEEGRLILVGLARFLAAHTPTRRELPRVVDIARRLRRGEPLHEAAEES